MADTSDENRRSGDEAHDEAGDEAQRETGGGMGGPAAGDRAPHPGSVAALRYAVAHDLYMSQRTRRDDIRNNVATPVAAFAFSVFNLSTLTTNMDFAGWTDPVSLAISALAVLAVVSLVAAAVLIVRVELHIVYLDPPDLRELTDAQERIAAKKNCPPDHPDVVRELQSLLAASYDIVYRRYFAENEQGARDRTLGLRLILVALLFLSVALCLLPFQSGGG